MTAGSGIVHSERSPQDERERGARLYGMQTWLALPDGQEEIAPAFEAQTDLPVVEDGPARAIVVMGELWGRRAPTTTHAGTIYAEIALALAGRSRSRPRRTNAPSCWSMAKRAWAGSR